MTAIAFDTHVFVKKMVSKGFAESQAEAIVEFVRDTQESSNHETATKKDVFEVKSEMLELELRIDNRLKDMQIKIGAMLMALAGFLVAIKYLG